MCLDLNGLYNKMQNLPEIDNLIKLISKLPGLGPKSAKRIILKMINNRQEILKPLANNLSQVIKNIERCKICGTLKPNTINCEYNNLFTGFFIDKSSVYYYNNKQSYKRFNVNEVKDPLDPLLKWMANGKTKETH